ncbi:MAG: branched-chain amino acid ABC transporter substrate-binding protein [SAR324 cluster bacterium]|nr:branched-chain amino acid ABC transporter substrate-binding protein [SAR324 cluster bacterium]
MKKWLVTMLGITLMSALVWAQTPLKIGVVGPYSGDLAGYGIPVKNAAILAVENINAAGGVNGQKIELVMEDDVCEPNTAINAAKKMVSEKVVAVIGHLCSGATEAALPTYKESGIILVSAASTNPSLTLDGKYPNFFRTIAHDAAQANLQVDFAVNTLKVKQAIVLHDKGAYGKGLAELVKAGLEAKKVKIEMFEGVTPGAVDYSALVAKIKATFKTKSKGVAIFFGGYHPEASKIVSEARKKKINAPFISGDGVKDPSFLKIAGEDALGYYASAPTDTSQIKMAGDVSGLYKSKFSADPGTFTLQGYAALQALVNAIRKTGGQDYNALVKALKSEEVETPLGKIRFDDHGDIIGAGFAMYQVAPAFVPVQN